jgi:hypothetical protein
MTISVTVSTNVVRVGVNENRVTIRPQVAYDFNVFTAALTTEVAAAAVSAANSEASNVDAAAEAAAAVASAITASGHATTAATEAASAAANSSGQNMAGIAETFTYTIVDQAILDASESDNPNWIYQTFTAQPPKLMALMAESDAVYIHDLTHFEAALFRTYDFTGFTITSIDAKNGQIIVGTTTGAVVLNLATGQDDVALTYTTATTPAIVNNSVNSVAMHLDPQAPFDPITKMRTPTVWVSTDGGLSRINYDGTVDSETISNPLGKVIVDEKCNTVFVMDYFNLFSGIDLDDSLGRSAASLRQTGASGWSTIGAISSGAEIQTLYSSGDDPEMCLGAFEIDDVEHGVSFIKYNPADPAGSPVADATATYSSGWYNGGIKGAWLSDTVAETISDATSDTDADRSYNDNPLPVVGSLTKAPVATGSELMAYSGFSATDYLEQAYNSDLDFGTGDFDISGWFKALSTSSGYLFSRQDKNTGSGYGTGTAQFAYWDKTSKYLAYWDNGAWLFSNTTAILDGWNSYRYVRIGTTLNCYINGKIAGTKSSSVDYSNASAVLMVGGYYHNSTQKVLGTGVPLSQLHFSDKPFTDEQIAHAYNTEKRMFEPGAKVTTQDATVQVTGLDYDAHTVLHYVGQTNGYNVFKDLVNISYVETDSPNGIAAHKGYIAAADTTTIDITSPAINLRAEQIISPPNLTRLPNVDWTGDGAQTIFALPPGLKAIEVFDETARRIPGEGEDYEQKKDSFIWSLIFAVAPADGNVVSAQVERT